MPNIKSAKKRLRSNERKRLYNRSVMSRLRTTIKTFLGLVESGEDSSREFIGKVYSYLDKAAKKNVIHKKKASRLKSRLSKKLVTQSEK